VRACRVSSEYDVPRHSFVYIFPKYFSSPAAGCFSCFSEAPRIDKSDRQDIIIKTRGAASSGRYEELHWRNFKRKKDFHVKTILVVDDAPMIRELLKGILEPEGYAILEAGDGEEALELVKKHKVDLSIIDIFLPKKGGLQVMSEIVKQDKTHKIIAISGGEAFNPDSILDLANIFEVAETFTKPLDAAKLLRAVNNLLKD
jgi:two-component system response regulator CpxR